MAAPRILALTFSLALASLTLLRAEPPRAQAQVAAGPALSVLDLATGWMYALKRGDTRILDNASAYPFELRMQNAPCNCEGGKARDAQELTGLLGELMKTEDVKALEVTSGDVKEVFKTGLPDWAKPWGKRLPKGTRLVHVESSGSASHTITCVLVIKNDQVRGLWLNAASGGG